MNSQRTCDRKRSRGKVSTLLLAGLAGMLTLLVLMAVVVAVLGPLMASAIVVFVGGLGSLVLLHYLTWGWWLGGMIQRDVEADEKWNADQSQADTGAPRKADD